MKVHEIHQLLIDFSTVTEEILEQDGFMALTNLEIINEYLNRKVKDSIHVLPENDTWEHTKDFNCKCNPHLGFKGETVVVIHNSFDGRECTENIGQN